MGIIRNSTENKTSFCFCRKPWCATTWVLCPVLASRSQEGYGWVKEVRRATKKVKGMWWWPCTSLKKLEFSSWERRGPRGEFEACLLNHEVVDKGSTELLLIRSRRCLVKQVEDQSKTGKIKYFFVQLVVNIWNSLPWNRSLNLQV